MKITAVFALGLALVAGTANAQSVTGIGLPEQITFPEGIAFDNSANEIFTASAVDGTVLGTKLDGSAARFVGAPGTLMPAGDTTFPGILGMEIDSAKRLWIAGGRTTKMFVLDTTSGTLLKTFQTGDAASLLNDVVVTEEGAYFTDTATPILWRVPITDGQIGELEPWLKFEGTPIAYGEGAGLNGIAMTPDGKTLIVVQMGKGLLFKIDVATKTVTPIDIGGELVQGGDGVVLDGQTLYIVRQPAAEIVTINLSADLASGKVVSRVCTPALLWPATAVKVGDNLLVVNSQFNKRASGDAQKPFSILSIPTSMLAGTAAPAPAAQ